MASESTSQDPHGDVAGGQQATAPQPAAPPPSPPPPAPPGTSQGPPGRRPSYRRPGATAGLVLIFIGALFLVGQVVPGIAWWSLWPLVIVGAGVIQAVTPGNEGWGANRVFDGLGTVAFGLVLLAITTGVVGLGVVWEIMRLWPVVLIALGLELLGKAMNATWVRAAGSVAVIGALVFATAVSMGSVDRNPLVIGRPGEAHTIDERVGDVREAALEVDAGVANVTLEGGRGLVRAEGVSTWGTPDFSVERSGREADVRLSLDSPEGGVFMPRGIDARLDASISRNVLWDIVLSTGVSSLEADLSDVNVRSLELRPGVADVSVRMGAVPRGEEEATLMVRSGVSSVKIDVPKAAAVRIESESGLTGHSIADEFVSKGSGVWESEGYASARDAGRGVWLITIRSGIGSIEIDTY